MIPVVLRLAFVSALALVAPGCGPGDEQPRQEPEVATGEPADPAEAGRTIQVVARDDLSFEPRSFEVDVGEVVTFQVTNRGATRHEFVLGDEAAQREHARELEASSDHGRGAANAISLGPGETAELTWRFTSPGALLAGCHEPGHYAGGMIATIMVGD